MRIGLRIIITDGAEMRGNFKISTYGHDFCIEGDPMSDWLSRFAEQLEKGTVPLLISRIARVCINGMVSAGHDIEDLFRKQVELYNLDKREQAEVMQLLADMGYALRQDRGYLTGEGVNQERSDNADWAANYHN